MAPVKTDIDEVEKTIQEVIQSLFQMMVQVSNFDSAGKSSKDVLAKELQNFNRALSQVQTSAAALPIDGTGPRVPEPLIQYVENGRNPDIYTREFVELVRRMNQLANGKTGAFRSFRDVLAHELTSANPELADDVRQIIDATGGATLPKFEAGGGAAAAGMGQGQGQGQAQQQQLKTLPINQGPNPQGQQQQRRSATPAGQGMAGSGAGVSGGGQAGGVSVQR